MTFSTLQSSATRKEARTRLASFVGCVAILVCTTNALGAPPLEPTGPPVYSFDANSPKVLAGTVGSADLLTPGPEGQGHILHPFPGFPKGTAMPEAQNEGRILADY